MAVKSFWRGALVSLGLALAVASPAGCHHKLPRLTAMGKHAEVIERVQNSRRLPRGKAGRAYATSLAAVGRLDEARAYFMWDFRHTGDVRSLVALGDLEVQNGLRGIALTRYSRAHSLDPRAIRGRGDVCDLLRDRARQFLAQGEGIAADQDFRRLASVCPDKARSESQLRAEIDAAATQQVRAQRALESCSGPDCPLAPDTEKQLAQARKSGPMALATFVHQQGLELPAADVVALLEADLSGQLGVDLLTHDQLRAWVGRQPLALLREAAQAHPSPAVVAYADLRLSLLGPAYSLGESAAPAVNQDVLNQADGQATRTSGGASTSGLKLARVLERLSEQSEIPPSNGWRVLALVGDLRAVEFELGTGLRNQGPGSPGSAAEVPSAEPATPPGEATTSPVHWAATGPVNHTKLIDLLTLARLRATSENADQALEIARFALANAHQNGVAEALVLARQEAWQRLASGQPWQAVAVMEAIPNARDRGIERAAGTAIALTTAVCGDSCTASDDRAIATRVMGDAWISHRQKELLTLARNRSVRLQAPDACPTLRELLAGDAVGPLAEALRAARTHVTAPGVAEALRTAVESDLTLTCAGRHAAGVMLAGGHRVTAEVLADALSQAPQIVAAGQLEFQAELAVIAQRREQAELISVAAGAASVTPRAYWRRAAAFGRLADNRDFQAHSLRQAIAHTPDASDLRQALIVRTLLDASFGEALRDPDVPAAREALMHQTAEYFDGLPVAARWQARERVAQAVADNGPLDDTALGLIRQALWPESLSMMRHPAALAALESSRDQPMFELTPDELAPKQWAAAAGQNPPDGLPAKMALLCPAREVLAGRLVLAKGASKAEVRRAAAIAVATTGRTKDRERAVLLLLQELAQAGDHAQRERVLSLLLDGVAASEGPGLPGVPVFADQRRLLMAAVASTEDVESTRKKPRAGR